MIEQQQIRLAPTKQIERLFTVADAAAQVASVESNLAGHFCNDFVIVHDHNACHARSLLKLNTDILRAYGQGPNSAFQAA